MSVLLSERGYTATSPGMVLNRAGLGKGSLYHHFDTKQHLALAAIRAMRTGMSGSWAGSGSSQIFKGGGVNENTTEDHLRYA